MVLSVFDRDFHIQIFSVVHSKCAFFANKVIQWEPPNNVTVRINISILKVEVHLFFQNEAEESDV